MTDSDLLTVSLGTWMELPDLTMKDWRPDVAKAVDAPIFHVNAQSMPDVANVFRIAAEYRQKF